MLWFSFIGCFLAYTCIVVPWLTRIHNNTLLHHIELKLRTGFGYELHIFEVS